MIEITHSRAGGSLLNGTSRGDGTAQLLKPLGWRWSRSIESWYLPRTRERRADPAALEQTRRLLEAAGHDVTVQVDDTARPPADVEADRARRVEGRAERLADVAGRRHYAAAVAARRADAADAAVPPGGEPVKYGTSGASRHLRALARARSTLSASVEADQAAAEADRRAVVAAGATDHHTAPATVAGRIARLTAEVRAAQRQIAGHTRTISRSQGGAPAIVETTGPATGPRRTELEDHVSDLTQQITYWTELHAQQAATGRTAIYGSHIVQQGDTVKIRGQWRSVVRASAKSVTVRTAHSRNNRTPWHEVTDHRPAADQTS